MAMSIPELPLGSTNKTIPCPGLGTATSPFSGSDATKEAVIQAIKLGYWHFDTSATYQTEKPIGGEITEALSRGLMILGMSFSSPRSFGEAMLTGSMFCPLSRIHSSKIKSYQSMSYVMFLVCNFLFTASLM